jgi:hypothetical protein
LALQNGHVWLDLFIYLIAHVVTYATYCKIQIIVNIHDIVCTCCIHSCCMQLVVCCNLLYAIMWKLVVCDSCTYKSIANASCKMRNFF